MTHTSARPSPPYMFAVCLQGPCSYRMMHILNTLHL